MDLQAVRDERQKWMSWKNIAPLREALESLEEGSWNVELGDIVKVSGDIKDAKKVEDVARLMMPWRKGPFEIFDTF